MIGGALAAAFGFGLSHLDILDLRAPAYDDAALTARLTEAEAKVAAFDGTLAALRAEAEAAGAQATSIAEATSAQIGALSSRVDALDAALAAAATISPDGTVSPGAVAAISAAVDALKADVAALRGRLAAKMRCAPLHEKNWPLGKPPRPSDCRQRQRRPRQLPPKPRQWRHCNRR